MQWLISFLKANINLSEIKSIDAPDFRLIDWNAKPNPKVSMKSIWGSKSWYTRVRLWLRSDSYSEWKELIIKIVNEIDWASTIDEVAYAEVVGWVYEEILDSKEYEFMIDIICYEV